MKSITKIIKEDPQEVFGDYSSKEVESRDTIDVVGSGNLAKAFSAYEKYVMTDVYSGTNDSFGKISLTSNEIDLFLQATKQFERENLYSHATGVFTTKLIEVSHEHGNSIFNLTTKELLPIDHLCYSLENKNSNDPLSIIVDGNLGYGVGSNSDGITFIVNGSVGANFGVGSNDLKVNIYGNTKDLFLASSFNGKVEVNGSVERGVGSKATNLDIKIKGKVDTSFKVFKNLFSQSYYNSSFNHMSGSSISIYDVDQFRAIKYLFLKRKYFKYRSYSDTRFNDKNMLTLYGSNNQEQKRWRFS